MRYAKSDDTRVYDLEKPLSAITKSSKSLVVYYNNFKSLWDECLSYKPALKCNCGVTMNCTCELPQLVAKAQENDVVIKFMIGLDESYASIRSLILMQSPTPSLAKIYSLLLQEESQRPLMSDNNPSKYITMMAKNAKCYKDKKKILKCFQIIHYPPGLKGPTRPRVQNVNESDSNVNANVLVNINNSDTIKSFVYSRYV